MNLQIRNILLFQLLLLVVLVGYFLVMKDVTFNHDTAWYFVATQRWLNGAELYKDIVEVNPPWSFYWTVPGIVISQLLRIDVSQGFALMMVIHTWISFTITQNIIFLVREQKLVHKIALCFGALAIVVGVTLSQFGQREHIFVLCVLPFLFSGYAEQRGVRLRNAAKIPIALYASAGILLKPYFVILPLAIALYYAICKWNFKFLFKIEYMVMLNASIAYVLFVYFVHKEYFTFIIPYALDTYDAYGYSGEVIRRALPYKLFFSVALASIVFSIFSADIKAVSAFGVAAIGGALIYFVQATGFAYQLFPFYVFFWIFLFLIFIHGLESKRKWMVAFALIGVCFYSDYLPKYKFYDGVFSAKLGSELSSFSDDKNTILVLSTNVSAPFPFMSSPERVWASRFPAQWFLPGALNSMSILDCEKIENISSCNRSSEILDFARNANVEDIKKYSPDIIAIDIRSKKSYINGDFDYLVFMKQHPDFESLWEHYDLYSKGGLWEIWSRKKATRRVFELDGISSVQTP